MHHSPGLGTVTRAGIGRLRGFVAILTVVLAVTLFATTAGAFAPPPLEGHVTDLTRTLSDGEKAALEVQMTTIERASTVQVAVLVLPTLAGATIEDVGYTTARAWRLGQSGQDNGVLLVIAMGERRIRIEVGKGLEGKLTDLQSSDIIKMKIAPDLKDGHLYQGIYHGVDAISRVVAGDYIVLPQVDASDRQSMAGMWFFLVAIVGSLIALAFILPKVLNRLGLRAVVNFGPRVGGFGGSIGGDGSGTSGDSSGTSGGGDGGGGFSGGGGDFGGGGASGSF